MNILTVNLLFSTLIFWIAARIWMREHMSKNRLAILPNLTHYEIFMVPELARTALPFLDGKSGAKSWSEQVRQ